ncbi:Fc receptor-like protein 1 isoform X4 [Elephas maximus indicus]|uniref:Fc receptor-like protein 1 isoform X4 n=1 Tax=Elephas maximus indicus TaxID=99487 RepID=UPI0021164FC4|nr:Fc receptor-like protein 1 isoform X4 [Elephas maximus indicus]
MLLRLLLLIYAPLCEPTELLLIASPTRPIEGSSMTLICKIYPAPQTAGVQLQFCFFSDVWNQRLPCNTSPKLQIPKMWRENSGSYWCEAKSEKTRVIRSQRFWIDVQRVRVSDVSLETQPPGGQVMEGKKLVLVCSVAKGTGNITFLWYKGAMGFKLGTKTLRSLTADFEILTARESDAEQYYCAADNGYGPSLSGLVSITVRNIILGNSSAPSGGGASFNLTAEHSGNYFCEADNGLGTQHSEAVLLNITVPTKDRRELLTVGVIEGLLGTLGPTAVVLLFCYWLKKKIGKRSARDPLRSPPSPVPQDFTYVNSPTPAPPQPVYENVNVVSGDDVYSLVYCSQQERKPAAEPPRTLTEDEVSLAIYSKVKQASNMDVDYEDAM